MSTRAQVVIRYKDDVIGCLYHHWDGYPSNMIERLKNSEMDYKNESHNHYSKVINYIISEDPACYEIEPLDAVGNHLDVEWMYEITVSNDISKPWMVYVNHVGSSDWNGELQKYTVGCQE